ncbi:MAG: hypothetical protein HKO98_04725 [Gemmatimonadetes bacterium]|nr:hypothetical protein [Gemmatimonadota bacterium]
MVVGRRAPGGIVTALNDDADGVAGMVHEGAQDAHTQDERRKEAGEASPDHGNRRLMVPLAYRETGWRSNGYDVWVARLARTDPATRPPPEAVNSSGSASAAV